MSIQHHHELNDKALAIIQELDSYQFPSVYPYVYEVLIAYSVVYFFIFSISSLIIVIPVLRGTEARRKHLWLWRRHYPGEVTDGSPYYVPNGGIAFVISQIFGSVIFEIYFYLAYKSLRSPQFLQHVHHHCLLAIGNAPGFFGFWYSGFGALYICLFSPRRTDNGLREARQYMPRPLIMNSICIGVPILVSLMAIGFGAFSISTSRQKVIEYDAVRSHLSQGLDPTEPLERYALAGHQFILQFRWASFSWSIAALLSVLFYSFTIVLFLRLFKETVNVASGKINLVRSTLVHSSEISAVPIPKELGIVALEEAQSIRNDHRASLPADSPRKRRLIRTYWILVWQCGLLTIVSAWYLVDGVFLTIRIGDVSEDIRLRSVTIWLVTSSSFLLAGALFLQSWRMILDQDHQTKRWRMILDQDHQTKRVTPNVTRGSSAFNIMLKQDPPSQ